MGSEMCIRDSPFTDTYVMRYPADTAGRTPWPAGVIDLRGPGF